MRRFTNARPTRIAAAVASLAGRLRRGARPTEPDRLGPKTHTGRPKRKFGKLIWAAVGAALGIAGSAALDIVHFGPAAEREVQAISAADDGLDGLRHFLDQCADYPGVDVDGYNAAIELLNEAQGLYRAGEVATALDRIEAAREAAIAACPGVDSGTAPGAGGAAGARSVEPGSGGVGSQPASPSEDSADRSPSAEDSADQDGPVGPDREETATGVDVDLPIPSLVGLLWQEAADVLAGTGFDFEFRHQIAEDALDDVVLGQSPAAGTLARLCCVKVEVVVKAPMLAVAYPFWFPGPLEEPNEPSEAPTMPDVVGLSQADAEEILGGFRLTVEYVDVGADGRQHGVVIGQYPPPGEMDSTYLERLIYVGRSITSSAASDAPSDDAVATTTNTESSESDGTTSTPSTTEPTTTTESAEAETDDTEGSTSTTEEVDDEAPADGTSTSSGDDSTEGTAPTGGVD